MGDIEFNAEGENQFFMKDNSTIRFTLEKDKVNGMVFDAMGLGVAVMNAKKQTKGNFTI